MTKKEILDYFSDINEAYNNSMSHDNLSSMLDELIGEDRQEIVRCKDCKNWIAGYITDQDDFIPSKCGKYQQMVGHSSDDFCSLAERR